MWTYTTSPGSTTIREWNITLNPFTAVYNRTITLNFAIGDAIGVKSSNVLITTNSEVTPNRYVEIDISGSSPVVTNKANLVENDEVVGSIVNDNNGTLYTLIKNTVNSPFDEYYLKLVNSSDYSNYYIIDITSSIAGDPSGLFINPSVGNYYVNIVDITGSIYQLSLTSPFGITPLGTVAGSGVVYSLYQVNTCFTPQNVLPAVNCGVNETTNYLNLSTPEVGGYFTQRVELGSGTGNSLLTINGSINTRYQIVWNNNIVADSLFLTGDETQPQLDISIGQITAFTQWNSFIYTPGTGNATTAFPNNNWTTNGTIGLNFTANDVAPLTPQRLFGSVGNQIGVVPNYPSPAAKATSTDIQLQFTKTLPSPTYVDIIVYVASPFGGQWDLNMGCITQT
jgi:hypothetical protein